MDSEESLYDFSIEHFKNYYILPFWLSSAVTFVNDDYFHQCFAIGEGMCLTLGFYKWTQSGDRILRYTYYFLWIPHSGRFRPRPRNFDNLQLNPHH
jgi:hypothetical protein